jgi:hypothetical protein
MVTGGKSIIRADAGSSTIIFAKPPGIDAIRMLVEHDETSRRA